MVSASPGVQAGVSDCLSLYLFLAQGDIATVVLVPMWSGVRIPSRPPNICQQINQLLIGPLRDVLNLGAR